MIPWFKRHSEYLRDISNALQNNSNYKEFHQERGNFFISCGEIVVRVDRVKKYPILILFPNATPYVLPIFIPLERVLKKNELELLVSLKDEITIFQEIQDIIKFYYYRHQGVSGNLCILETDNISDKGAEHFSINSIINRVRDWFAGISTGRFPPDSAEVELYSHFSTVNYEYEFLIPEAFGNTDIVEGEFYSSFVAKNPLDHEKSKSSYIGSLITGVTTNGVFTPIEYRNALHNLPRGIDSFLDLHTKGQLLQKVIKSGDLIKAYWWDIENEPTPFKKVNELVTFLNHSKLGKGVKRIHKLLESELKSLAPIIFVAVRFLNRRDQLEWQVFSLSKTNAENLPLVGVSRVDHTMELLQNYSVSAIYCESITDEKFHQRNARRAERETLKDQKINIIGCGALGSEIADSISKAGVGAINLIDYEPFRFHNSVRHLADASWMGFPKVIAVQKIIQNHNPFNEVVVNLSDVTKYSLTDYTLDNSISISSIADNNIESLINEQAVLNNKTVFYTRALRGGKAARVFRVIPGNDACMNCLTIYQKQKHPDFISIPDDVDLPTITNECNNPIRPASAADLKIISALTSRLLIDFLQVGLSDANHWIWAMENLDGIDNRETTPFGLHSRFLPPHPECYYCQEEAPRCVSITRNILNLLKDQVLEDTAIETGGVLVGNKSDDGNFNIVAASGPGPNSKRSSDSFEKDVVFCQNFIDNWYRDSSGTVYYLGEWHSHPIANNKPSNTDLNSLSQISIQKEYLTDKPIMIIFSNTGEASCTIHPAHKRFYFVDLEIREENKE